MKDHLHPKKEQHCLTKKRRESNRPANKHEINEMTYNRTEIYLQITSPNFAHILYVQIELRELEGELKTYITGAYK